MAGISTEFADTSDNRHNAGVDLAKCIPWIVAALILAKWLAELGLSLMNRRHVLAHADAVPAPFRDSVDAATYAKSVHYTLAKSRLGLLEDAYDTVLLTMVLFSGVLPAMFKTFTGWLGISAWATAAFLVGVGVALALAGLPFQWYADFHLEQRFGFNTTTTRTWWGDRLKGFLLALALGYPLLVLALKFVEWTGAAWWLWAWAALVAFQLVLSVLAPVLILPLFNRFTPLPDGSLRSRLLALAKATGFRARNIEVMDGSKRSRHSNAFFTGVGRFRKIVLFDTLIAELTEPEVTAVLAHEIGHFKLKHVTKLLVVSAAGSLVGLWCVSRLAQAVEFYRAFGFDPGNLAPALLLFGLLAGTLTFWLSPAIHGLSRRHEYTADAFAAEATRDPGALIAALRKLNQSNLSNLTPHPLYSGFYYSHPTLLERERAFAHPAV